VSVTKNFNFNSVSSGIPTLTISRTGTPTAGTPYALTINDNSGAPTGNGNANANWVFVANSGNYCSFSGGVNSGATVNLVASRPTTCTIQVSQSAYGIYAFAQSQGLTLNFVTATSAPIVLESSTAPVAGGAVIVSVTANTGNGNPNVQYSYSGSGCTFVPSESTLSISTTGIANCVVQAKQDAYQAKSYALSSLFTLYFGPQNYLGTVQLIETSTALASIPFPLQNNATNFSNQVSYQIVGTGCVFDDIAKTVTTPGGVVTYCSVVPFWKYGTPYNPAYYNPVTLSFNLIAQTEFVISNAITTGSLDSPITVTTRGGSGAGAITFTSVSSKGNIQSDSSGSCNIVNNANGTASITSSVATTCAVTATKAAASQYRLVKTQTVFFTFK
jgi:hypothetical protein